MSRAGLGRRRVYCSRACQQLAYRTREQRRGRRRIRREPAGHRVLAAHSGTKLTRRATEVAQLIALGLTNREIAERLFVSERTVEWHVEQILNRLTFGHRSQIAAWVSRTEAAPLPRPTSRRVSNLPTRLTEFVGRRRELARLRRVLSTNRLVTVAGPGGIGKTRMAVKVAEQLTESYPDGVWLCELASVADPAMVGDALAQVFGIADQAPQRLVAVKKYLRERRLLLVLDNCEHVQTAVRGVVQELLAVCPRLRILATSRAPLGMLGEAVWRVAPLELEDAVRLFRQRAEAAVPGLHPDAESMTAICHRLDGVPLALELAAPKLRVLSLQQLSDAVLDPARQSPDAGRHGSLEAVADWSYRLLEPDEQWLFRRVSAFAGSFEEEDAAALATTATPAPVLLAGLAEKSMLIAERLADGVTRYRLLEVLKPFARARLAECGELQEARMAHAERMVWLAERMDLQYDESLPRLEAKLAAMVDDLRAALETLLELNPSRAAWIAAASVMLWLYSGRLQEGLRWTEAALAASPAPSAERCYLLYAHATLLLHVGRRDECEEAFREANLLAGLPDCTSLRGDLWLAAARIQGGLGNVQAAERGQRQAIDEFTRSGHELKAARALNHLALSMLFQRKPQEAKELAARSVTIRRQHATRIQTALDTLAQAHAMLGDLDSADSCFLEATALGMAAEDLGTVFCALHGLAYTSGKRERSENALRLYYCAQHLLPELSGRYEEPLAPYLVKLVDQLQTGLGPERSQELRSEGEALKIPAALRLMAN